jgi:hypothetical protein
MTPPSSLPADAVIRVSRGDFDPARFAEVEHMTRDTGDYLVPAIRQLDGLIAYYAGASPSGSMVHVSLWHSEEHAEQMGRLKEMIVDARRDADAVGVSFIPIINYPIIWEASSDADVAEAAVIRVAVNDWDPAHFDQAADINMHTSEYLIPAIQRLEGLVAFYDGISPAGSLVNASLWRGEADAEQMDTLKEMIVHARDEFAAVGARFHPNVNYPIAWRL